MKVNPWIAAFAMPTCSAEKFERRAVLATVRYKDLNADFEEIRGGMLSVFLCSKRVMQVVQEVLAVGESHAKLYYENPQNVIGATFRSSPWGEATLPAVMLTGLAGVGKSGCLDLLSRILCENAGPQDLPGYKNLSRLPGWFMSIRDSSTLNAMLRPYVESPGPQPESGGPSPKSMQKSKLLELSRRISRRDGTCLTVVDELQFLTHSSQANTQVTGLLLNLMSLGPRLVYACNFSLGHRLKSRRQEDRQRLLAHPIVLEPDASDSSCFQKLLKEYFLVAPDDFDLNADLVAEEVHRFSFGVKRAVVNLLSLAWLHAKTKRGRTAKVGPDDIHAAYFSPRYLNYREDTELLWRRSLGDGQIREDLVNPFASKCPNEKGNVVAVHRAMQEYQRQVAQSHLDDLMTPAEKCALKDLQSFAETPHSKQGKVLRVKRSHQSKDSMLEILDRI